uniref:Similar to n=1 Tax=Caenorhabditis tropicalis TaxID=1561998 RepID=A0A1I7UXC2_9PELO
MDPDRRNPINWITYLYNSIVYYFWLIYAQLPQRITDDKSSEITRDADIQSDSPRADDETQTVRQVAAAAPKDSASSFDSSCNNCLTPHSSSFSQRRKTCSPSVYVSNISKKPSSSSIRTSSTSSSITSESSTITPDGLKKKKIIAVVPSGSHVLVGVPKLDWKTESIRIKRTRMSDWLDAEQRDVMRQFDEVIRIEEEAEEDQKAGRRGILKIQTGGTDGRRDYGYGGSIRSIESSSTRSRLNVGSENAMFHWDAITVCHCLLSIRNPTLFEIT